MKVKKINKNNFFSEKKEKTYMKRGDNEIIEIRKNFHPPKNAEKDEIYIENEKNDYIKYLETKNGCSECYFEKENKCPKIRRKKCSKDKACFIKIEEHEIFFDDKLVKNTFDYLRYPNLKTEINELDSGEHFILED